MEISICHSFLFIFSQSALRYTYPRVIKFPNRIKENIVIFNTLHKILKNPKINIENFIKIISKSVSFKENNIWKRAKFNYERKWKYSIFPSTKYKTHIMQWWITLQGNDSNLIWNTTYYTRQNGINKNTCEIKIRLPNNNCFRKKDKKDYQKDKMIRFTIWRHCL